MDTGTNLARDAAAACLVLPDRAGQKEILTRPLTPAPADD